VPALVLPSIDWVPIVFVAYGACLFIGSNIFGRLYDRLGWHLLLLINLGMAGGGYLLLHIAVLVRSTTLDDIKVFSLPIQTNSVVPVFLAGLLLGGMEALFNCFSQATLLKYFRDDDSGPAFALFRCVSAAGTAIAFVMFLKVGYVPMMLISGIGLVLAAFSWTYYSVVVER